MTTSRFTLVALSPPRAVWIERLTGWATEAALPIELSKALSADELASRFANGHRPSAVLVDERVSGLDRDLLDAATRSGALVIVVTSDVPNRDWVRLGAATTLPSDFEEHQLLRCVRHGAARAEAAPLDTVTSIEAARPDGYPSGRVPELVAVCGGAGAGSSTIAQLLAQGASTRPGRVGDTCLVDLATRAHQALLHDTGDVLPGLQELVEAGRSTHLDGERLASLVWKLDGLAYDLVIGLRRTQDWTAVTPKAFEAALTALLDHYGTVVADIDSEFDGEQETGSLDIEERNHRSRRTVEIAGLVIVCGTPTVKGFHDLVNTCDRLRHHDVPSDSLARVVNFAPRGPRARARLSAELARFDPSGADIPTTFVETRTGLEACRRAGAPLPTSMVRRTAATLLALIDGIDVGSATARSEASDTRSSAPPDRAR